MAPWRTLLLLPLIHNCTAVDKEEVANLAHSLMLAASPFGGNEGWQPSSLARRLNMSQSDEAVGVMEGSETDMVTKGDDGEGEESRVHEVRVSPPFSVTRSVGRDGKSLYTPGPTADRWVNHDTRQRQVYDMIGTFMCLFVFTPQLI